MTCMRVLAKVSTCMNSNICNLKAWSDLCIRPMCEGALHMRESCSMLAGNDCSCPMSAENVLMAPFSSFMVPRIHHS